MDRNLAPLNQSFNLAQPMEDCPFCRTRVQFDAIVCPGCGAEKHFGPSRSQLQRGAIIGGLGGFVLGAAAEHAGGSAVPWVIGGVVAGYLLVKFLLRNEVEWLRNMTTRRL